MSAFQSSTNRVINLKKGEHLFKEGDRSQALYLLQSGMIRVYVDKGSTTVELDVAKKGDVLGELSFLDGKPRSSSVEAITDCVLIEISSPTFLEVIKGAPLWLKYLIKTIVSRLRASDARIRELDSGNVTTSYSSGPNKNRVVSNQFLTPREGLRVISALLLAIGHKEKSTENGIKEVGFSYVSNLAFFLMSVPHSKIPYILDLLSQMGAIEWSSEKSHLPIIIKDLETLDRLFDYMNSYILQDEAKKLDLSVRSYHILREIGKAVSTLTPNEEGNVVVNLAAMVKTAVPPAGAPPFRINEMGELLGLGIISELNNAGHHEVNTTINLEKFRSIYPKLHFIIGMKIANQEREKIY